MSESADRAHSLLTRQLFVSFPAEAARALESLAPDDIAQLLAAEEPKVAAALLRAVATPFARSALLCMEAGAAAAIAAAMPVPWAASRLRTMPAAQLEHVMELLPPAFGKAIRRSLHYSQQSVGSLMDPTDLSLAPDSSAQFALAQISERKEPEIECMYVVDRSGSLLGAVRVGALVAAAGTAALAELVDTRVPTLGPDIDARSLAAHPGWAQWRTLPVVDGEGNFLGSVSYHSVQSLLLDVPLDPTSHLSLPVSIAELFWLGLVGITDGLARTVATKVVDDER